MKGFLIFLLFLGSGFVSVSQTLVISSPLRFLALGDSYTIGENVPAAARWPVQLCDSLVKYGSMCDTLQIIATTGWRTDNLLNAISGKNLAAGKFSLVSLLIGVNNQYQKTDLSKYKKEFPQLLDSAIRFAGKDRSRVIVLSIPDYAYTPFGQASNPAVISSELDQYNKLNKHYADSAGISYFDITPISRQGIAKPDYVAADGLHPSGKQYSQWVSLLLSHLEKKTTSVKQEVKQPHKIMIWPNPVNELLHVTMVSDEEATISVFNILGRRIMSASLKGRDVEIPMKEFPAGIYFVEVSTGNTVLMQKILKP